MFKRDAGAGATAATVQTVYAEDGIGSTVLGQYGNRRSGNSTAPAGEMESTEVIYLPTVSGLIGAVRPAVSRAGVG
ncbi:hypothetical protein [Paracidovorax anthurii]|uniref:hypothetical protein n=1 Tax=Paracidovorax anthurii TaxID=78229 RepID=UPI00147317A7|nr:hypothetical protein [Paracidovorax anthurii]